ncbi:MAG TPA: hypothetical protein ENI92_08665, partial [Bacteroidetes bacterium]|nr:hypothetical protein [Bacteroidota bacterium]
MNEMDEEQQIPEGMEVPETLDEQAAPVAGKGSNKAVFAVIIVLMLAFQAVSSYFIVKTLFFSKPPAQTTVKKKTKKQPIGEIYQLPGLIVNPTGSRGTKVLLVDLGLETHNSKVMVELQAREPQIRDN